MKQQVQQAKYIKTSLEQGKGFYRDSKLSKQRNGVGKNEINGMWRKDGWNTTTKILSWHDTIVAF